MNRNICTKKCGNEVNSPYIKAKFKQMEKELSELFKANHGYLLSGRSASRAPRYNLKKLVENGDMVKTKWLPQSPGN